MGKSKRLMNSDWMLASIAYPFYKLRLLTEDERIEFFKSLDQMIGLCNKAMRAEKGIKEKARQEILARNLEWLYCPPGKSWLKETPSGSSGTDVQVDPV